MKRFPIVALISLFSLAACHSGKPLSRAEIQGSFLLDQSVADGTSAIAGHAFLIDPINPTKEEALQRIAMAGMHLVVLEQSKGDASDAYGRFLIADLKPGIYEFKASFVGYLPVQIPVELYPNRVLIINVFLEADEPIDECSGDEIIICE
jgi:hypothetical protein